MLICKVKGNVVATVKDKAFIGFKVMIVKVMDGELNETDTVFMAVDAVGVGAGEVVLVNRHGSSAKSLWGPVPFNAVITGVIDEVVYRKDRKEMIHKKVSEHFK